MEAFIQDTLAQFPVLAPAVFILLRAAPVVIAPIPGLAFDLVGLAVFGWKAGFVLAYAGVQLGALVSFGIARFFREPAVRYFAPIQKVHEWEERYSVTQKFWMLVLLRLATSPFFDYVGYAAGLARVGVVPYVASTLVSTFPLMFAIYYFGGLSFGANPLYAFLFFIALLLAAAVFGGFAMKRYGVQEPEKNDERAN